MARAEREIAALSSRLQADLLMLNGKQAMPTRQPQGQLLLPIAVVAAVAVLLLLSPKVRKRLLWQLVLLAATHID